MNNLDIQAFSPCSGLVISGYSKGRLEDPSWHNYLTKAVDQYKKFKKMYNVDKGTDDFKG